MNALHSLAALTGAAWVLLTATAAGGVLAGENRWPWGVRLILGWTAMSLAGAALCAFGLAWPPAWLAVSALLVLAGRQRIHPAASFRNAPETWALAALMAYWIVVALAPETLYDAAGYHLGLPAEWLRTGGFPNRISFFELLPQGMETIFAFALATGARDSAARLIHLTCVPALAGLLAALAGKAEIEDPKGRAAGLLFAGLPVALLFGSSAYTDLAWTLALLAALFLFQEAHAGGGRRLWLVAGLAAGFCYAVKMPSLLVAGVGFAILAVERRWRPAAWFSLGVAAAAAPWLARSWMATGNPLAPLLNGVFRNAWFGPETGAYVLSQVTGRLDAASMLRGLLWEGGATGGFYGPSMLLLPLAAASWRYRKFRPVLLFGLSLTVFFALNQTARYLLPAFALLGLGAMAALPARAAQTAALLLTLAASVPAARFYALGEPEYLAAWPWRVAFGGQSRDEYLRMRMPVYAFADLVNQRVPAGAAIFDCAGLPQYYVRHALTGHWTSRPAMEMHNAFLRGGENPPAAAEAARRLGIGWIALPPGAESAEWARLLLADPQRWGVTLEASASGYRLYRILDP